MQREVVSVDKLLLWQENPRVKAADSQMKELDNIYNFSNTSSQKTSKRQLMKLVESIAENGYQNDVEPILVKREGDHFVVQDANRRLSSIKLLLDPDKYRKILDEKDFEKVKSLAEANASKIPKELEVVVFEPGEEDTLKDILSRKHNGPLDGAGTLPWGTEAKGRFFGGKKLSDFLEQPFEEQFGQSLTSYLGGANALTSTRRVFGFSDVRKYLDIKDQKNVTPQELDRVKEVADELKGYCQEHNVLLSRLRKDDVKENVIIPLKERNSGTNMTPYLAMKRTSRDTLRQHVTNLDRYLGSRYNDSRWLTEDNENFIPVNLLLAGLRENGKLSGEEHKRWAKAYLLAPSVRVIYELSLQGLVKSSTDIQLPNTSVSKDHGKNVKHVHELFKDKQFSTYLDDGHIVFDSYLEARSVIESTDFGSSVDQSQLLSHKSAKSFEIDTIVKMFNEAVLFAVLCQQYVVFKNMPTD